MLFLHGRTPPSPSISIQHLFHFFNLSPSLTRLATCCLLVLIRTLDHQIKAEAARSRPASAGDDAYLRRYQVVQEQWSAFLQDCIQLSAQLFQRGYLGLGALGADRLGLVKASAVSVLHACDVAQRLLYCTDLGHVPSPAAW